MNGASEARERLELYGSAACSDAELVANLVGCSEAKAAEILAAAGGLVGLASACPQELRQRAKVSRAMAARLSAALALAGRVAGPVPWRECVRRPADVAAYVRARIGAEEREHFVMLGLDARQRIKSFRIIAIGSLAQVDVHPRELFRPALREGCHTIIVAHNHPSGDAHPSAADIELTRRLVEVGKLTGIAVLDHLVVTQDSYASMQEMGLM